MPWVKIDDGFFDNVTNRALGPAGRDLFVAGLAFCAKGLTDGRIPKDDLPLVLAAAQAKRGTATKLVQAGRWIDRGDHYEVDEYLTYQLSREQVTAEREKSRERQRRAREKARGHGVTDGVSPGEVTTDVTVPPTRPDLERPPQPPASGGHDGTHSNCRACGTNPRGSKPKPSERPLLPPSTAPEGIADFDHHPPPRLDDMTRSEGLANVRELKRSGAAS